MKKILSLAIVGIGLLVGSTGAFASQCGVSYSGYHRPAPHRPMVVNHYQRPAHRITRNQCGYATAQVQRNCGNRNYQRNYQRVRAYHPMPQHGHTMHQQYHR
ncbi:MAG TPA: hypothetical protein PLM98_18425 [Thiolinea sp.]|nr:hypothetical protein [Thiolinea sp.]